MQEERKQLSQREFIIKEILKSRQISRNFALRNYISRLGSYMCTLQNEGYDFNTEFVPVKIPFGNGKGRDYLYTPTEKCLELLQKDFRHLVEKELV